MPVTQAMEGALLVKVTRERAAKDWRGRKEMVLTSPALATRSALLFSNGELAHRLC